MSLIVASSSQEQYGGVGETRTQTLRGVESPSQFQNYFTSPIKVPKDAEIAVESVKIRRDALVDIESATMMYKYFGKLQTTGAEGDGYNESRLEMPIPIRPNPGTYNAESWLSEVADKFNISYGNPEVFGKYAITGDADPASGKIIGTKISIDQRGDGSASDIVAGGVGDTMIYDYWKSPWNLTRDYVDGTQWTVLNDIPSPGSAPPGKKMTRLASNPTIGPIDSEGFDEKSSVIGNGCPFALVNGVFNAFVKGAPGGWRVGLSRPQMEYTLDTRNQTGTKKIGNLLPGTRHPQVPKAVEAIEDQITYQYHLNNTYTGRYQKDFYDYMVMDDGTEIKIYQLSLDTSGAKDSLVMSEVVYYGNATSYIAVPMTSAVFKASFDGVEFRSEGDELSLWFTNFKTPANDVEIVGDTRGDLRWNSFLPLSECKNALYPRINIADQGDSVVVAKYTSHWNHNSARVADAPAVSQNAPVFRFPTYDDTTKTFTTGDDFYTNNRVGRFRAGQVIDNNATIRDSKNRPYALSQTLVCDTKDRLVVDQSLADVITTNIYDGLLAASAGVNKKHGFIIGHINPRHKDYYLEGKYATTDSSGQAKMNRSIGYPDRSFIDQTQGVAQGYATAVGSGQQVIFQSFAPPDYRVHSAFVRISNMPIQSYNGAKTSVSKILYHLPRFTNDGREYGDLFFAPGEKTYVKLHNPSSEILNNIEVQIVDVNERPINDISGNTIVVFHLK